jgi:hypothetical protein
MAQHSNVRARSRVLQVGIGKKHKTPQQRNAAIGFGNGFVKLVQGVGEGAYDFVSLPGMECITQPKSEPYKSRLMLQEALRQVSYRI